MDNADVIEAVRLALAAENAGSNLLDDPYCFDREFGPGAHAKMDGDILRLARGFVEGFSHTSGQLRRDACKITAEGCEDESVGKAVG